MVWLCSIESNMLTQKIPHLNLPKRFDDMITSYSLGGVQYTFRREIKIQTIRKDEGTWFFVVVVMCVKISARRMEILFVSHTIEFSANIPPLTI